MARFLLLCYRHRLELYEILLLENLLEKFLDVFCADAVDSIFVLFVVVDAVLVPVVKNAHPISVADA